MFIGHFGLGMGIKKTTPSISLGTLFIAVQLLDLVWPFLLLFHVETVAIHPELSGARNLEFTSYPYTHSLVGALIWSVLFGGVYFLIKKNKRQALVLGAAVFSHWVLDLLVHFHDLPLWPGASTPYVGFGLWDSVIITNILEGLLFGLGILLYVRSVTFKNLLGKIFFALLIALFLLVQVSNLSAPPPPNVKTLAWMAQLQWIFVLLAYWVDRNTK